MTVKFKLAKRLRYSLDNMYSKGTGAMIFSLGLLSLVIILISAVVLTLTGLAPGEEAPFTFPEAIWLTLLRSLGSGAIGGRDSLWEFRFLMLGVTLGGVFVLSSLIGVLTNGMQQRLEELRKGHSEVMETGHTVILGWSEQIFTILPELVAANASEQRSCVVILGEREKVEMEDDIRKKVGSTGRTRVVCRTGNPLDRADLNIASLITAKSILILSPQSSNPDADVFKVVLAILNHPDRRKGPYHIVAGLRDPKNTGIAKVIGKDEVEWIQMGSIVSRIIAQTCRQSGLSILYSELLDFGGNEIYFHEEPALVGKTFGQALLAAEKDSVIGIFPKGQKPRLGPPMDTPLRAGDQVIVIAKDDRLIAFDPDHTSTAKKAALSTKSKAAAKPEHTLILGWNWRGPGVIHELDHYVAPGSDVLVVADRHVTSESIEKDCQDLKNQKVCFKHGDTTDRGTLEELGLEDFDHVIILCYSDKLNVQQADAQTLITLLQLRDLAERRNLKFSIVSEMLDVRNRELAVVTQADDFIVSDRIISLMMAQVAENKGLSAVFEDLFDPKSAEIYFKPAHFYVRNGQPVNFYTVVDAARQRGEVAVGYRIGAQAKDAGRAYGVVINPPKTAEINFNQQDRIIVLANT